MCVYVCVCVCVCACVCVPRFSRSSPDVLFVNNSSYLPIHIIFERLEAVTVLNIWRVIRNDKSNNSDTNSLGPVYSAIATK